ncbi:hypothetical protein GH714_003129 [Hevea brasiliensis]|uniref:Uncharacterized protein n=1 Tax=Hevea brasiliensis TaxID=3981 RepID=A0A6A6KJ08_HEVBR|nr:hypothetical protein GH714_003129 [Hevea brasiliensis]
MASATTRPTFSFHLSQVPPPKPTAHFCKLSFISLHKPLKTHFIIRSVDVSKEDKPPATNQPSNPPIPSAAELPSAAESPPQDLEPKFDQRRLEEKFAVLNTGIYECRSCGTNMMRLLATPHTQFHQDCRLTSCLRTGGVVLVGLQRVSSKVLSAIMYGNGEDILVLCIVCSLLILANRLIFLEVH